jgi:hypothetical protein
VADDGSVRIQLEAVLTKDDLDKIAEKLGATQDHADKAKNSVGGFGSVLEGIGQGIGQKVFSLVSDGLSAIANAAPQALASLIDTADTFVNISDQTGIATSEIQAFSIAGAGVGVTGEEIAGGLAKLQKGMAENSTSVQAALGVLGKSSADLRGMAPEKQLSTILGEIQKIPDPTQRTAVAMELLGRGGVALIPLGAGLEEVTNRARDLGTVMSDETLRAADALGDRVGLLGQVWDGLKMNLVSVVATSAPLGALLDGITDLLGAVSKSVQDNSSSWQEFIDNGVYALVDGMYLVLDVFDVAVDVWTVASDTVMMLAQFVELLWSEALLPLGDVVAEVTGGFVDLRKGTESLSSVVDVLQIAWTALKFTAAQLGIAVLSVVSAYATMTGDDAMVKSTEANITALREFQAEQADTANAIISGTEVKNTDARATDSLRSKLDALRAKVHAAGEAHTTAAVSTGKHTGTIDANKKATEDAAKAHDKLVEALKKVDQETSTFAVTLAAANGNLNPLQQKFGEVKVKADELRVTMTAGAKTKAELDAAMAKVDAWENIQREITRTEEKQRLLGRSTMDARREYDYLTDVIEANGGADALNAVQLQGIIDKLVAMQAEGVDTTAQVTALTSSLNELGQTTKKQDDDAEKAHQRRMAHRAQEKADLEAFQDKLSDAMSHFGEMADVLQSVGVAADNTFVKMLHGMQQASDAGKGFRDAWKNHDWVGAAVAGVQAVIAVWHAASEGATESARMMGGALAGASAGSQIGGILGPKGAIIGAGVGAVVGTVMGAIADDPGWKKTADHVGAIFGVSIKQETAQAIEDMSKTLHTSRETASNLFLGTMAAESGREMRSFRDGTQDLMNAIANGVVPAKEGLAALGQQFTMMRDEARESGRVGDASMLSVLNRARELGQVTPEMAAHVNESLASVAAGMKSFTAMFLAEGIDPMLTAVEADGTFDRLGKNSATIFMGAFAAITKEQGIVAAVEQMGDSFDPLYEKLKAIGDTGALAILQPFTQIKNALSDETIGPMVQAVDGLRQVMVGMADAGYLDTQTFAAMQTTSKDLFDGMVANGLGAHDAISLMAPEIQAAVSAAEQMGIPLNADMQSLKDIAEQNGITFKTDPMLRMAEALEAIAHVLGAELPSAADRAATSLVTLGDTGVSNANQTSDSWSVAASTVTGEWEGATDNMTASMGEFQHHAIDASGGTQAAWTSTSGAIADSMKGALPSATEAVQEFAAQATSVLGEAAGAAAGIGYNLEKIPRRVDVEINIRENNNTGSSTPGNTPPPDNGEPDPLMLAGGGIIQPRVGGTPAIIGEGGATELAAPVVAFTRELSAGLADQVGRIMSNGMGGGAGGDVVINYVFMPGKPAEEVSHEEYARLQKMHDSGQIIVKRENVRG